MYKILISAILVLSNLALYAQIEGKTEVIKGFTYRYTATVNCISGYSWHAEWATIVSSEGNTALILIDADKIDTLGLKLPGSYPLTMSCNCHSTSYDTNIMLNISDINNLCAFTYDANGNRILRRASTTVKAGDITQEQLDKLGDLIEGEDMQGMYYEDSLSNSAYIRMYPNPTADIITVSLPPDVPCSAVSLASIDGQALASNGCEGSKLSFDLTAYPKGAYLLQLNISGMNQVWTVIKQ